MSSSSRGPSFYPENMALLEEVPLNSEKGAWDEDDVVSSFSGSVEQPNVAADQTIHTIKNNTFGPGARIHQGNVIYNAGNSSHEASAQDCRRKRFLTDPAEDRKALKRKKGDRASGTCAWLLETEELTTWLGREQTTIEAQASNILWLHGNPGTGKSTMAIFLTEELPKKFFTKGGETLIYFFCDSSFEQRKRATSILRGLLYQLIQQHLQLLDYLLPKYTERGADLFNSFDALWTIFLAAAGDQNTGQKYCIIDALDECDSESQQVLLQQFQETFQSEEAPSNIRFLITSRPYSEICEYLEEFPNKDLASFPQSKQDIDRCIKERVAGFSKKKKYTDKVRKQVCDILRDKAEGTFLWVGLACEELANVPSMKAIQLLQKMPKGLHSLYKRLLDATLEQEEFGADTVQRVLSLVAVCTRPLSVLELSEACQIYQEEADIDTRIQFTRDQIASCRLLIIIQDEKVLLLHQSVKDYLVGADSSHFMSELEAHASIAYRCVNLLIEHFQSKGQSNIHFLSYATEEWVNHARMAQSRFEVRDSEAEFFRVNSPSLEHWMDTLRTNDPRYYYEIPQQFSILHIAGRWGVASLVDYVANQNYQRPNTKESRPAINFDYIYGNDHTPVGLAIKWGHTSVATKLLCLGANVSKRMVMLAARSSGHGKELMTLLLDQRGDQIIITEDIVKAAASNENGKEMMALLLDRRGDQVTITENVLKATARNRNGKEMMALLLDRLGEQLHISEGIIRAAASNANGKEMMALFLDRLGEQLHITEGIVKAAAFNENGKEVMALLLDRRGDQVPFTKDVVAAAARSLHGDKVMALFLDRRREQFHITEDILKTVASNGVNDKIMTLLLDRRGDQVTIPEDVLKAAARNMKSDEVMALFLNRLGEQIHITEDIVKAAAENSWKGKEMMALLLGIQGDQIVITKDVIKAAAGNAGSAEEIMTLLFNRVEDQMIITEEVVKTAAGNEESGEEIMALLFDKRGDQIIITEEVVKAAAANEKSGVDVMALLFKWRGDEIVITEEVIKAAAGNEEIGEEVTTLLLNRRGSRQIAITEEVVKAAATCGQDTVLNLLSQQDNVIISNWDKWRCISKFYNAAKAGDIHCVKQLIHEGINPDIKNTKGETPLWIAASNGHEAVVELLAQRTDVDVNSLSVAGRSPLYWPSWCNFGRIVAILMEAGADPRFAHEWAYNNYYGKGEKDITE